MVILFPKKKLLPNIGLILSQYSFKYLCSLVKVLSEPAKQRMRETCGGQWGQWMGSGCPVEVCNVRMLNGQGISGRAFENVTNHKGSQGQYCTGACKMGYFTSFLKRQWSVVEGRIFRAVLKVCHFGIHFSRLHFKGFHVTLSSL